MANYMRPTKSMERHFSNAEQDVVRQAFLPTTYVQLRRLPSRLRPGCLSSPRMQHVSGMSTGRGTMSASSGRGGKRATLGDFYSVEGAQGSGSAHGRPQSMDGQGAGRPPSHGGIGMPGGGRRSMSVMQAKIASRQVHGTVPRPRCVYIHMYVNILCYYIRVYFTGFIRCQSLVGGVC